MIPFPAYPKIATLGSRGAPVDRFVCTPLTVTEKIDGSQIGFMFTRDSKLYVRSKGGEIDFRDPPKLFAPACVQILAAFGHLIPDTPVYGEAMRGPKHNRITYDRPPHRNIMLWGGDLLEDQARWTGFEQVVSERWFAQDEDHFGQLLLDFCSRPSQLGGPREGCVITNEHGQRAKYVTEAFRETSSRPPRDKAGPFELGQSLATEARYEKALECILGRGEVPDIGKLCREVSQDVEEECDEEISRAQARVRKDILRGAVAGVAKWFENKGET